MNVQSQIDQLWRSHQDLQEAVTFHTTRMDKLRDQIHATENRIAEMDAWIRDLNLYVTRVGNRVNDLESRQ